MRRKAKGIKLTAEVTPPTTLLLTDDSLIDYDTNFKMNPPLRTKTDVLAMLEGLKDGTIDCITSDHAPHAMERKRRRWNLNMHPMESLDLEPLDQLLIISTIRVF